MRINKSINIAETVGNLTVHCTVEQHRVGDLLISGKNVTSYISLPLEGAQELANAILNVQTQANKAIEELEVAEL